MIVLGTRQQLGKCANLSVRIGDVLVEGKNVVRNLGVMMDDTLTFANHVQLVSRSAYSHLRIIARVRKDISYSHRKMLIDSLVISRIDYCVALFNGLSERIAVKLQRIIKAASRLTARTALNLPPLSAVQAKSGWLNVRLRIRQRILVLVYEALHQRSPDFLAALLSAKAETLWSLRSTERQLLHIPRVTTEFGRRAFSVAAPSIWNATPLYVREAKTHSSFILRLDEYLSDS